MVHLIRHGNHLLIQLLGLFTQGSPARIELHGVLV